MFDLEKLKDSYCGDLVWLKEIEKQMSEISIKSDAQRERFIKAYHIINILYRLNYIVLETEINSNVAEYNGQVQEIYSKMKYDLTELLGITEFWNLI